MKAASGVRSMHVAHGLFVTLYLIAPFATGVPRSVGATPLVVEA